MSESSRPRERPGPRAAPARSTISFSFNLGKIAGQGEDSDPILRDGRDLGLVAVFDGMGGAGGTVYETSDGPRSGAYLASRLARDVVERRMLQLLEPEWNLDGRSAAEDLRASVEKALAARLSELNAPPSALRSKLLRALPTTMALAALQRLEPAGPVWSCHVLWAGDSRVYVFEPERGAHQLTTDDVRDRGDAMTNLREDSVVSNAMSADTEFVVHHRQVELTVPFLLVAATDGCFGYVRSPMHFERLLLRTLLASDDARAWSEALQREITAVTGDDAALALLGVGADHDGFKARFEARVDEVEKEITAPIDVLDAEVARAERHLDELRRRQADVVAETWARYKPAYEQYLDDAAEDQPS